MNLGIPGMRTKKNTVAVVARQLTEDHLRIQYDAWTPVYTDGSINRSEGAEMAAAFFQAKTVGTSERLAQQASSTTAELAAKRPAIWGIRVGCSRDRAGSFGVRQGRLPRYWMDSNTPRPLQGQLSET